MPVDAASVNIDGPWEHRFVSANGARFHVAELGEGPLVLMLHGFPQHWYTWRHQMLALADDGYRVAAMELRGYGGSDKPPRGYDTYMGTLDAAAVIRARGESGAVVAGQGLGAWIAWCMPTLRPDVTKAIAALSMPHPRIMRHAMVTDRQQR
ncbi:MAG: alpha/beta hydrolase, partial [Dermatophilaceae bacterium]